MIKTYVYKITRSDDLEYIGITVNPTNRFNAHRKSNRFSIGIKKIEILEECDNYEYAEDREEFYINEFNTYKRGLNCTPKGKEKSENCKFNTLGFKFSDKSKKKMSESAKKRGMPKGRKHSDECKKKLSDVRKGKCWGPMAFNYEFINQMRYEFENELIKFDDDFIRAFVKKTHIELVGKIPINNLIMKSGHKLTYKSLFIRYYAKKLQKSTAHIKNILDKKSYYGAKKWNEI